MPVNMNMGKTNLTDAGSGFSFSEYAQHIDNILKAIMDARKYIARTDKNKRLGGSVKKLAAAYILVKQLKKWK